MKLICYIGINTIYSILAKKYVPNVITGNLIISLVPFNIGLYMLDKYKEKGINLWNNSSISQRHLLIGYGIIASYISYKISKKLCNKVENYIIKHYKD